MPKIVSAAKRQKIIQEFSADGILSDGSFLRCSICEVLIRLDEKHQRSRIKQHIGTGKHMKNKVLKCNKDTERREFISNSRNRNEFFSETAKTFVECGIPLSKLNNPILKSYLQKYTGKSVPDESTLRKSYLQPLYEETLNKIRQRIADNPAYFILDESTDRQNRYVLNILVAPLNGENVKAMLLKTYFLHKTDNASVMQSFNDACALLWPGRIKYNRVWLVLTDQASYMLLAISNLKTMYSNLKHVTCIGYTLHRVCEAVKDEYSCVNEFVSCMMKILKKAPARIQQYIEITGLPLPPSSVHTRWGSWLKAAIFLSEHFKSICNFLEAIPNDSLAVKRCKELAGEQELLEELITVHGYSFLKTAMTKLEEQCPEKEAQWAILMDVKEALEGMAKRKLEQCLTNNPDVEDVATNKEPHYRLQTKYASLVSVDVQRLISTDKYLLSDRRFSLTETNIEILNVLYFNSFLV